MKLRAIAILGVLAAIALLPRPCAAQTQAARLLEEIRQIKAIDNHAHPLRVLRGEDDRDNEEDALDLLPMPPFPLAPRVRSDNPEYLEIWRTMWGYPYHDSSPAHLRELLTLKSKARRAHAEGYSVWVLNQLGTETMLANRVAMGSGLSAPRFRWVAFDDALMIPLNNARLRRKNSDYDAFYQSEEVLLRRYLSDSETAALPSKFDDYLSRVVTPTLERQKKAGALAVKFEAAYLRSLDIEPAAREAAARIYERFAAGGDPSDSEYKIVQDFIFRYIAREAGRLGLAVHIHVAAGVGSYFDVRGTNPLLLESIFDDPDLRNTNFVMIHGGWPFTHETEALLAKPNVYADFSFQTYLTYPRELSAVLRSWIEYAPEKILYGSDAFSFSPEVGWEESGWIANDSARRALALALDGMIEDGEITRQRALAVANMVLRDNAIRLYGLQKH